MKLDNIQITGFRSLNLVSWSPGDLNVVIGANGAGKSNLLRFLEMMSASAQGKLDKWIISQGGMIPLLWDGRESSLSGRLFVRGNRQEEEDRLDYHLMLEQEGNRSSYRLYESLKKLYSNKIYENIYGKVSAELADAVAKSIGSSALSPSSPRETVLSTISGPLGFVYDSPATDFQRYLADWRIYHDIPTHRQAEIRQSAVVRNERTLESDSQNLIAVLHTLYTTDRDFECELDSTMRVAFGEEFEKLVFPPDVTQRVELWVRWKSLKRDTPASDLSDGTLRFLFLITALLHPNPGTLIAIDEPETGLHPSMFPLIAELAASAAKRTQVIFTTHADQFLSAFRDVQPTATVAEWKNGATILRVVDQEELAYWLESYSLGELYRSGQLEQMA